jgi:hypothetical protein
MSKDWGAVIARLALQRTDKELAVAEKQIAAELAKIDPKHVAAAKRYLEAE